MFRKTIAWVVYWEILLSLQSLSASTPQLPDLLKAVTAGSEDEKIKAINQLEELGVSNEAVVTALSNQLKSDSAMVRAHAVHAIGVLKAAGGVNMALPLVFDKDTEVRHAALHALQELKPGPQVTLPLIDKAIREADPQILMHVLTMAAEIGKPAVPSVMKLLDRDESAVWGCIGLGAIGPDAAKAVPALTKLLDTTHQPKLRLEAAMALASIGPASASALPELSKILDGKDAVVLPGAIFAVGRMGPAGKPAEKKLRELAARDDTFTRVIATWAILKLNPENPNLLTDSLPTLVAALTDDEMRVRAAAAKSLVDLKPRPQILVPAILKIMNGASHEAMNNIVEAVGYAGAQAVPVFIKALDDEQIRPRIAAILSRLGPEAKDAAPALAEIVEKDPSPATRREALIALGAMGPFAAEQAPIIAKTLGDDNPQLRTAACYALGKIGPLAISQKKAISECLKSDDELCRIAAAWALTRIDPLRPDGGQFSVPYLVKSMFDPDAHVRLEAVNSLKSLGPQAEEAVPALKKAAFDDPQAAIRIAAAEAVKTIEK